MAPSIDGGLLFTAQMGKLRARNSKKTNLVAAVDGAADLEASGYGNERC
jgi:hypothetical protein